MGKTGAIDPESCVSAPGRLERQGEKLLDGYNRSGKANPEDIHTPDAQRFHQDFSQRSGRRPAATENHPVVHQDGFVISRRHHRDFGGKRFSQLPEDIQASILSYEVAVDLLINLPDPEVLDIFGRLNSYAVILNEQEKLNAEYFGAFKVLADAIGRKYNEYWIKQGVFTAKQILRMAEVNLAADLLIAMNAGIKSKKQIRRHYALYEDQVEIESDELETRFDAITSTIAKLYPEGLSSTEFRRPFLFYTLFTSVGHCLYELPGLDAQKAALDADSDIQRARNGLDRVSELFEAKELRDLSRDEQQFLQDGRRATTDENVRQRRTKYLLGLMR